jgi:hypothetical protein
LLVADVGAKSVSEKRIGVSAALNGCCACDPRSRRGRRRSERADVHGNGRSSALGLSGAGPAGRREARQVHAAVGRR